MADPIAWGLEIINGQKTDKVQDTLDGLDFETPLENGLDKIQEAINNAPVGGPLPFPLASFIVQSQEDGIKLTYSAYMFANQSDVNYMGEIVPYGVMIRYSDEGYPQTPTEGILVIDDTDLFEKTTIPSASGSGNIIGKEKTATAVGLTNNTLYYFSAFPYSYAGLYNTNIGPGATESLQRHRTTCTWTGTAATLTVTITQDLDIFALGEITVTLTPTAGGDPLTQSRTGPGDVIFSGLTSGQYTLSFSAATNFTAPDSQEIDLLAGVPNIKTVQYTVNTNLSDYTWGQIVDLSESGVANQLFSVKDTKDLPLAGNYNYSVTMEIVGFNHDNLTSGGKAGITFGMKGCMRTNQAIHSPRSNTEYFKTNIHSTLNGAIYNSFPEELRTGIKQVQKKTVSYPGSKNIRTDNMKVFLFSNSEIGLTDENAINQGVCYEKFINDESRQKKVDKDGGGITKWWTRSPSSKNSYEYHLVLTTGKDDTDAIDFANGISFGFCV